MKIAIGSDHAGFALKSEVVAHLEAAGHQVVDLGTDAAASVDYPDFGSAVGQAVSSGDVERGVAVCGSGVGICIAANKVAGVRAVNAYDVTSARLSRAHNDANVICLGERLLGIQTSLDIVDEFLVADFEGGRHARRVEKLSGLDN